MSGKIIQFIPRESFGHGAHESLPSFSSRRRPDDLAMDHADTAPCEYSPPPWQGRDEEEPA